MVAGSREARDGHAAAGPMGWTALSPGVLAVRILVASALIALLCVCAWRPGGAPRSPTAVPPMALDAQHGFRPVTPPAPAPVPIPTALFDLAEPGIDPVVVTAAIDPRTGLRADVLNRGDMSAIEAQVLRVTLTRGGSAGATPSLFVLMARRAAAGPTVDRPALPVVRTGPHGRIQTKFGAVDTLEITFGHPAPRTCLGFVTRDAGFRLDGWSCAPLGQPPQPQALACTLDALSLVDLGDPETTAAFSAAPPVSRTCPVAKVAEVLNRSETAMHRSRNKK